MKMLLTCVALLALSATAYGDTVQEVTDAIVAGNAYVKKNMKGRDDDYSKEGAVEFWSSGGLMQMIDPDGRPGEFETFDIDVKHIHVTPLVEGRVAVAHYYSEGSMKPKGYPAVTNYRTRVSQVFVKEDGEWKVRSSHWSAISGGAGTSQTALEE